MRHRITGADARNENRGWRRSYRGPLYTHAGIDIDTEADIPLLPGSPLGTINGSYLDA